MTQNAQPENAQTLLNNDMTFDAAAETISNVAQTQEGKKSMSQMMSMVLMASLQEIQEYTAKIKDAKTQAKRDFYNKKIQKVSKRLKRLMPQ